MYLLPIILLLPISIKAQNDSEIDYSGEYEIYDYDTEEFEVRRFSSRRQCLTTNDSPSSNTPCSFPFKFKGKLRRGCITEDDPDGRFWCSTKTDDNFNHIGGNLNYIGIIFGTDCQILNFR